MYPGQNERAGKRHSKKTRTGNRSLRDTLMQAALGARHKKDSALQARSHRVKRQRGHKRAVVAVGRHILEIAYYIMRDGVTDHELAPPRSSFGKRPRVVRIFASGVHRSGDQAAAPP